MRSYSFRAGSMRGIKENATCQNPNLTFHLPSLSLSLLRFFLLPGRTYDRFCGGALNTDSNEHSGIPIYSRISTQVTWLQVSQATEGKDKMSEPLELLINRVNFSH